MKKARPMMALALAWLGCAAIFLHLAESAPVMD
jgi:hypothetical protein